MGFKERVDKIGGPLSKEELEAKLFGKGKELIQRQLKLLEELDALKYLTNLRDELISPEQNPVIKKVLRYETIEPMTLVRRILDPEDIDPEKKDLDYRTRWHLTDFTPEMEVELTARLLQKFGFDALIERPLKKVYYAWRASSRRYDDYLYVCFDLCWKEDSVEHRLTIVAECLYFGGADCVHVKTQSFQEKIKMASSQDEFEEFLAHAFLQSEYDPEKEKEELEKAKKETARSGIIIVPVPVGPSLEMQLMFQQSQLRSADQITSKLEEIRRRL